MNSVEIIVRDGDGKEVNPFGNNTPHWLNFESAVKSYRAPGIKDGTHMARLQWQYKPYDDKSFFINCSDDLWETTVPKAFQTRQIWVLSPDGEGEKDDLENHFYLSTEIGPIHVNMNPNADPEVFESIKRMAEIAFNKK